ncbi:unnamed protein product, partial [marine sediment metagenome]
MSNWGNIAIAVRCGIAADPIFLQSWTRQLLKGIRPGDRILSPVIELPQHFAAEAIATTFLKGPADTVLYIDDDMVFEPEDLEHLRDDPEGADYDALMGLCLSRNSPHRPVIMEAFGEQYKVRAHPPEDTIVDVAIVGLAFTLIRRSVFERVNKIKPKDELFFRWNYCGDSEDASFSQLAIKAGCKLGVNTRVIIGHRIKAVVKWDFKQKGVAYEEVMRRYDQVLKEKNNGRIRNTPANTQE